MTFLSKSLATLLIALLVAPSIFLIAPQKTHALLGAGDTVIVIGDTSPTTIKRTVDSTITSIKTTISAISNVTSAAAEVAQTINDYVLQPLAFILSGNLLKALTASVLGFVLGAANGTGIPQFVTDLAVSVRTVQDSRALHYIENFDRYSNSPFRSSISSYLRVDYLAQTSLDGWFASHRSTLDQYSPNSDAFLRGDWSQGGWPAWFALTTQDENNPYLLAQSAREERNLITGRGVGGASGERLELLRQGDGFMGWCGPSDPVAVRPGYASRGVSPVDPCLGKLIRTPGSIIKSTLEKVLGGQQDQILRMGNVGKEINGILGNVASVMQTVNFGSQLLGGGSGGLLGANDSSGAGSRSRLSQFANTPGYLGVSYSDVYENAANLPSSGEEILSRIDQYEASWTSIGAAASTASTTLGTLVKSASCSLYAADAQAVLTAHVAPVLAQAVTASTTIASARTLAESLQQGLSSGNESVGRSYASSLQQLQSMPPSATDVAKAEEDARESGAASANPEGSLTVSGGSVVDRMNLIAANALAMKAVCAP